MFCMAGLVLAICLKMNNPEVWPSGFQMGNGETFLSTDPNISLSEEKNFANHFSMSLGGMKQCKL